MNDEREYTLVQVEQDDEFLNDLMVEITPPTLALDPSRQTIFDILGLNKAHLLRALYNRAVVVHGYAGRDDMSVDEATRIIKGGQMACCWHDGETDFRRSASNEGWVRGRRLNIDLSGDEIDVRGYDRANGGSGTAFGAIKTMLIAMEAGLITPALDAGNE